MIEFLQHLFGFCPDHSSHLNMMDMIWTTGGLGFFGYAYYHIKSWFVRSKNKDLKKEDQNV